MQLFRRDHTPRAGRFSAREARRAQIETIRAGWIWFLATFVVISVVTVLVSMVIARQARGLVLGAGLASAVWTVAWLVNTASGAASRTMGADAARWTTKALRSASSDQWRVMDEVVAGHGSDVDHLLFGPGGVCAIETKWSSSRLWFDDRKPTSFLLDCLAQARRAAGRVTNRLNSDPHRIVVYVKPILVVWGPAVRTRREIGEVDGVVVVPGASVKEWVKTLPNDELPVDLVARIETALEQIDQSSEGRREVSESLFLEKGIAAVGKAVGGGALGGIAALFATLLVWSSMPMWWALGIAALMIVFGIVLEGMGRFRLFTLGWVLGVAGTTLVIVGGTAVLTGLAG